MRKAAGIILITSGVLFICDLILILFVLEIMFGILSFLSFLIHVPGFVFFLGLFVVAAFSITGGIFCLRRKYWRVCLASASFAVFYLVFFLVLSPFPWVSSWSHPIYISTRWPIWVMLVAAVISVIFILRTKKEWEETSDIMDSRASNDG